MKTSKPFELYPEFVEDDTRKDRKKGYKISAQFLDNRYAALLPPHIIHGNTILDLGAAIGSAGAWSDNPCLPAPLHSPNVVGQ